MLFELGFVSDFVLLDRFLYWTLCFGTMFCIQLHRYGLLFDLDFVRLECGVVVVCLMVCLLFVLNFVMGFYLWIGICVRIWYDCNRLRNGICIIELGLHERYTLGWGFEIDHILLDQILHLISYFFVFIQGRINLSNQIASNGFWCILK